MYLLMFKTPWVKSGIKKGELNKGQKGLTGLVEQVSLENGVDFGTVWPLATTKRGMGSHIRTHGKSKRVSIVESLMVNGRGGMLCCGKSG